MVLSEHERVASCWYPVPAADQDVSLLQFELVQVNAHVLYCNVFVPLPQLTVVVLVSMVYPLGHNMHVVTPTNSLSPPTHVADALPEQFWAKLMTPASSAVHAMARHIVAPDKAFADIGMPQHPIAKIDGIKYDDFFIFPVPFFVLVKQKTTKTLVVGSWKNHRS